MWSCSDVNLGPPPHLDLPQARWAEWPLCSVKPRDGAAGPEMSPRSTLLVIFQSIYGFIF